MQELDRQLTEMKRAMIRREQLLSRMDILIVQRDELQSKEQQLAVKLDKEQTDVEKLEGGSLSKYLHYLLGNYDEKLDTEKQEAYEAQVRYDAVRKELDSILNDFEKTSTELYMLADCEEEYQRLLQRKSWRIQAMDAVRGEAILQLDDRLETLNGQHRELKEALRAGKAALEAAQGAALKLNEAAELAFWDMFGDGVLLSLAKLEKVDAAQTRIEELQVHLRSFYTELADVSIAVNVQVEIDKFLYFTDWFFDNIFTDWIVKDHIENCQRQVADVISQIREVLQTLETMFAEIEAARADIQAQRDNLIVEY